MCVRVYMLVLEVALGLVHAGQCLCPQPACGFVFQGQNTSQEFCPLTFETTASR